MGTIRYLSTLEVFQRVEILEILSSRTSPRLKTIVDAWHYWREADPETYRDANNTYFFIDYMSLPQFKRSAEEQTCFQRAMKNMHMFYASWNANFTFLEFSWIHPIARLLWLLGFEAWNSPHYVPSSLVLGFLLPILKFFQPGK